MSTVHFPLTDAEPSDYQQADLGFGKGGVPWYLLLFYLSFLCFFVWFVLEYQLPSYLETKEATVQHSSEGEAPSADIEVEQP